MKRNIMCIVALFVVLCILVPANMLTTDAKQNFYSTATIVSIKDHIEKDAGFGNAATAQGCCSDGKYAYFAINNGNTTILKYDVNTWKLKKKSKSLNLGHANDMAYNPKKDYIVIANNAPDFNIISFLDPDTLEVISTKKIKQKIYSIAYNEKRNQYVVGISGTYDFAILDSKFKLVKKYKGYRSGYLRQGADCDDDHLYFVQSGGGANIIVIYDWEGKLVDTVAVDKSLEIENIFHVKNTIYITLHHYGNFVHRIGISDKTAIKYKVKFDADGGYGEMDSITVTYGKSKKLPDCTYYKDGYIFGGWIMKQDSYKKYYGKKTAYSKSEWLKEDDIYEYTFYEDNKKISKTTNVGDVTAKAFWISENYRVYYDSNGGDGNMPFRTVMHDEEFTLDKNILTKSGYVFAGWTAQREYDHKIYGYGKKKDEPRWLHPDDVHKKYVFKDEEAVSQLTYDKGVTFAAVWQSAFVFSHKDTVLDKYVGIDENVEFPYAYDNVQVIAKEAFAHNATMKSVTIPQSVTTIEENAFYDCKELSKIYFDHAMPQNVDYTAFDSPKLENCYLITDTQDIYMGWYLNHFSYDVMSNIYKRIF